METLVESLLDASGFMPRGSCGPWTPGWRALAITADLLYGVSYLIIPCCMLWLWYKRRQDLGPLRWGLKAGAGFIMGCGITHLCQVVVWWWPAYRLFVVLSVPGALLSVVTAVFTPAALWYCLRIPTAMQMAVLNAELHAELAKNADLLSALDLEHRKTLHQVEQLEQMRKNGVWTQEQKLMLSNLAQSLRENGNS